MSAKRYSDATNALSIITVTYQSGGKIGACLDAAQAAAPSAEIIVVDNGSTDATKQLARTAGPNVKLVCAPGNIGFGRGCNLGADHATGSWLLFINPDLLLRTLTIPPLQQGTRFGLGAGFIAPDADGNSDHGLLPGVRAETTLLEDWVHQVWKRFIPRSLSRRIPVRTTPISWAVGALVLTRRDEYKYVGGFDPRYFLFFEDRDLARRYRTHGFQVTLVDGLVGSHVLGTSSQGVTSWTREAWSIVSWLEYLAIWRGPKTAARTASSVLGLLASVAKLPCPSRPDASRLRQKVLEAQLIVDFVRNFDRYLPEDSPTYYPGAREALTRSA